jgi:integrase/recombinase XerC
MLKNQIANFENYLITEHKYSKHTSVAYLNDVNQFFEYCSQSYKLTSITDVSYFFVREWIVALSDLEISPRSINRKISSLSTFFRFMQKTKQIQTNPAEDIAQLKIKKKLPEVIKSNEIIELLNLEFNDFESERNLLIISILYQCGLRRSELTNIKIEDINFQRSELKILGKGNKQRIIPLSNELTSKISNYLESRKEIDLFSSKFLLLLINGKPIYDKLVYTIVTKYLSANTTASSNNPHALRHSFATHMADNGAELDAVKKLLGHANLSATQIYMHNSISKLKEIYSLAHPKSKKN